MKLMGKRAVILLAFCACFGVGLLVFFYAYIKDADTWATYPVNAHLFQSGQLAAAGDIRDRNGTVLAATVEGKRQYHESAGARKAVLHLVGDRNNNIATSMQMAFRKKLTGWNHLTGAYSFSGQGHNLTATVDLALCRTAQEALNGRRGTVGVLNYRTGELLCMVSSPTFDPSDPPDVLANPEKYEGVYLNRLLSATYTPGSIFKLVTAAAAIEQIPDLSAHTFHCAGALELEGGLITCMRKHGEQSFGQAMTNSCNIAFAQLAVEIGAPQLQKYAEKAGLEQALKLDGIRVYTGTCQLAAATEGDLGWAGVGQYKTLINPLSYLQYVGAIANGGERVKPHILKQVSSDSGLAWLSFGGTDGRALTAETAAALQELMRNNVLNNYGEGKLKGYEMCAKSGTAEVGNGQKPHSWFTGFLATPDTPLAFIVIVENGGAGSSAALEITRTVMREAVKLEL